MRADPTSSSKRTSLCWRGRHDTRLANHNRDDGGVCGHGHFHRHHPDRGGMVSEATRRRRRVRRERELREGIERVIENYEQWVRLLRRDGPGCRAGLPGCKVAPAENHHLKLRAQGGSDDDANRALVCAGCHRRIHANPGRSYRAGFLIHPWEAFGEGDIRGAGAWTDDPPGLGLAPGEVAGSSAADSADVRGGGPESSGVPGD